MPKARIELASDPYQGPVLPLNYIGISKLYHIIYKVYHTNNGDFMRILITGASSGIAFLTGCVLIDRGHFVYMTCKTDVEVEELKKKLDYLSLSAEIFKLDITLKEDRDKIKDIDIDVLFLHAGVGYTGSLKEIDIDTVKDNFEVNVFSNLQLIQLFLKHDNSPKKVIMTSSLLANHALPFFGSYVMTKTAIEIMMKTLYRENLFNDDKFIVIRPGAYQTGFNQYMILSGEKNKLSFKKRKMLNGLFSFIEYKKLNSIVYKIVLAIEKGNKNIYSAPLSQTIFMKIFK